MACICKSTMVTMLPRSCRLQQTCNSCPLHRSAPTRPPHPVTSVNSLPASYTKKFQLSSIHLHPRPFPFRFRLALLVLLVPPTPRLVPTRRPAAVSRQRELTEHSLQYCTHHHVGYQAVMHGSRV